MVCVVCIGFPAKEESASRSQPRHVLGASRGVFSPDAVI